MKAATTYAALYANGVVLSVARLVATLPAAMRPQAPTSNMYAPAVAATMGVYCATHLLMQRINPNALLLRTVTDLAACVVLFFATFWSTLASDMSRRNTTPWLYFCIASINWGVYAVLSVIVSFVGTWVRDCVLGGHATFAEVLAASFAEVASEDEDGIKLKGAVDDDSDYESDAGEV